MNKSNVKLFLGDDIEVPSERSLVLRLQRDLERLGVRATLYANFFPVARKPRQVDLLVRTATRTAHVEIKGLNAEYPVRGRANGPWLQLLPDGTERPLATNAGRQALDGTYAIGDAMSSLARTGAVTAPSRPFKHHIDSIVTIWQTIPAKSDIEAPPHVTVLGYGDLLRRLLTPGPIVAWTDDEWDSFARHLNLFQPETESSADRGRRSTLELLTDYRLRARATFADALNALVDLGAITDDGAVLTTDDIDRRVAEGHAVALVGPSGIGKSFTAQHLAVRHCDQGRLVVWIRAGEYEQGRFSNLLARSMAPFSAYRWSDLTTAAPAVGVGVTLIVDGLNECPENLRAELLQQLQAFTLRHPAGVLVTSTTGDGLNETLPANVIWTVEPDDTARLAILVVHGAKQPARISEQFRSPYDLSIAAACESELHENASVIELHAAYIRRFAPTEQVRGGLRALATRLHAKLRSSLPLLEVNAVLNSSAMHLTPGQVDDVLSSPLLFIDHHRVRFRHDLVGQFLAAEDLVRSASSGGELARLLESPANAVLIESALAIDPNAQRVWDALRVLADPHLIFGALNDAYGAEVARMAAEAIQDVLRTAINTTIAEGATFEPAERWHGRWVTARRWTTSERALLASAGHGLAKGLFVDEICHLLDRTDQLCLYQIRRLKSDGDRSPISNVVAATFTQSASHDDHGLAVSHVATALELFSLTARSHSSRRGHGLARRILAGAGDHSWGRLYLAVLLVDSSDPVDQTVFASLLRRAWIAGGYHLQLEALRSAEYFSRTDEPYRTEILDIVKSFQSNHWALQSSILEVLARFGEIVSGIAPEDLRADIREVISHPNDIEYCRAADAIVSNQFENEDIVGPYCEAIEGLTTHERARLFAMAARGADPAISSSLDYTLNELADLIPTGDSSLDAAAKAAFATFVNGPVGDSIAPTEAIKTSLAAIRGWAKFDRTLPPEPLDVTNDHRMWRLLADLVLRYERDDVAGDPEETWRSLLLQPGDTVVALASLEGVVNAAPWERRWHVLGRLIEDYPTQLRQVFEWALQHPAEVPTHPPWFMKRANDFVIRTLGAVGDEATAELLHIYTLDPDAGPEAVDAIRRIHQRLEQ
jgi:hypothetical protein